MALSVRAADDRRDVAERYAVTAIKATRAREAAARASAATMTAQRVDVGLVLLEMLGAPDAADYLAQYKIPADVSDRVLIKGGVRQRDDGCRRELALCGKTH